MIRSLERLASRGDDELRDDCQFLVRQD